jgi:potassium-dependent mechanosensitive channel
MRGLVFLFNLLFITCVTFAQPKHSQQTFSDSLNSSLVQKSDSAKNQRQSSVNLRLMMTPDTLTGSDYMMSIDRVNDNLNAIRDSAKLNFEVVGMSRRIYDIAGDVSQIRQNLRGSRTTINSKNLYLYQSFASGLDNENDHIQKSLNKMYKKVFNARLRLKTILSDSVFHKLYTDSNLRIKYDTRLVRLERKWARTDSLTKANIDSLNAIKIKIADNSVNLSNMLSMMESMLDRLGEKLFGAELSFLWQIPKKETLNNDSARQPIRILGSEQQAIRYYFSQTSGERVLVLIFGILLAVWLFLKRKLLKLIKEQNGTFGFLHLKYLIHHPVLSLVLVLLCLMPFFDAYAPTSYVAIEYFLLLASASVILLKRTNQTFKVNWFILGVLFVANMLIYILMAPTFVARLFTLAVHAAIILYSLSLYKKLDKQQPYYKGIRISSITAVVLMSFGILFNLFGRFSLAGLFGIAGLFAITQSVVLAVFVEIFIEIVLLQLQSSRLKKGFDKPFDSSVVINKIRTPLVIIATILWLIMLTSNLNIYHSLSNSLGDLLTAVRSIGSISFKLISVVWFFVIIWIAHTLQRLISFLFGETGDETDDTLPGSKGQHSRLLITRLLVLIGGYLLAIAASGLPIDRLTIVLGALGVGIGMGLQNVVNNFVSGIILIFDGTLQIGDEIEINGQAGKVKEIGLRSSTLNTPDGADVIIPNGNILSQNIVSWTLSNDQKRVTLEFKLSGSELDANVINDIINSTVTTIPGVTPQKKPVILYTRVTTENCWITVHLWSTINNASKVRSEAMLQLSAAFSKRKIGFL